MADFNRLVSAGEVVNRVLGSLGLPRFTNVASSSDATARQLWALLNECGQDLIDEYDWQILLRTYEFTTGAGTEYALPADFQRFIGTTGWNNTSRLPLIGPINRQQWRMLQARQLGGTTLRLQYVIEAGLIKLYFAPTPAQTLAIDYVSRAWIQDAAAPTTFRDQLVDDADIVLFPPRLMVAYLKHKWRDAKGFDSNSSYAEYRQQLSAAKGNDMPKKDLNLAGRAVYPYLGVGNLPDTHLGS